MGMKKSKYPSDSRIDADLTVLTSNQIRFLCEQTNLIDREVRRRHAQFLSLVPQGRMNQQEWLDFVQNLWPTANLEEFARYLFYSHSHKQYGYIDSTAFILLHHQLNDSKSVFSLLFDMFDTHQEGSVSLTRAQCLIKTLEGFLGHRTDEDSTPSVSHGQVAYLNRILTRNQKMNLSRKQFMNIMLTSDWIDEENGVGSLLTEHSC